jgi:hypothetical protein
MAEKESASKQQDAETRRTAMTNGTTADRERCATDDPRTPPADDFAPMRHCCAPDMVGLPHGCPCKAMFARHRFAAYAALALIGLSIATVHVGAVLGILAFLGVS